MTIQEFSDQFDVLLNSYYAKADFGDEESKITLALNEYEKSVYLTKSQEEYVISLYNGRNPLGESFEEVEEVRRYLANLIKEATPPVITNSSQLPLGIDTTSKFFTLPLDVWFITYEAVSVAGEDVCGGSSVLDVIPVTQDEYHKVKRNPFRGANKRRALRLDLADGVIEVVCKYPITTYYVRYIRKPKPIILVDLPDGLKIENENKASGCELHEALHQKILEGAVMLALQSAGFTKSQKKE